MEAARPRGRRRRARRGTVDRPLNTRLVRVAFFLMAPALLAVLFSLSTTGALPRPPLEPVFDGTVAAAVAAELSTEYPSRIPGSPEGTDAARWYTETISALGLQTDEDIWSVDLPALGKTELRNLVTAIPGRSEETLVVVAHRDNRGAGQAFGDNASGTAALIEIARGYAPQETAPASLPQRTLVLVSTDAGAYGGAGAARFAAESAYAESALAAIVLDGLGGRGRPRLAVAGNRSSSPARALVGTAAARVEEQAGEAPALPGVVTQLVDLAIPYAAGEQGFFLARGVAALTLTTDDPGDPNIPAGDSAAPLATRTLSRLGRASEAVIGSIDGSVGAAFRTQGSVFLDERAASGWTVRLALIVAVVPFALGVFDLLVRSRRRGLPFGPALSALATRLLMWTYVGFLLWIGALTGIFPTGDALPAPPYSSLVDDWFVPGVALLTVALLLGWLVSHRRLVPWSQPSAEERLAGYTVALGWIGVIAIVVALAKPYALIFVLPSLYAWLWLPLRSRLWSRAALFAAGLSGPAGGVLVLGHELDLGVIDTMLYVVELATVGYVAGASVVLALAWAAAAAQLGALAFGRYAPYASGGKRGRDR
jgi:hypothetical protein